MAQEEVKNSIFQRLRSLFDSDVIVRNVGGKQLKVIDSARMQSSGNLNTNRRSDRYRRMYSTLPGAMQGAGQMQLYTRLELFRDYEAMDTDSILSSALDVYADECTVKNEFGDVITVSTTNEKVHKVLHNLFYDILNVEFNLWPWVRNAVKYGDFFLKLNVAEKFGVIGVEPISAYEMIREEQFDPENPDKVRFQREVMGVTPGYQNNLSQNNEKYDNFEIAHFRLLTDTNFLPYGRSILEGARKVWKQVVLMEDAMLIHRIMRAPDKRVFKIDIGNIAPHEVDGFMEEITNRMKKVPYVDPTTGEYNLKYNMQNLLEDFYFPVRGAESGTSVEPLQGIQYDSIADIEYLRNRMMAALKIPKAYLGYEEDTTGKSTLASQDFRFARTVERIQRIIVSELYKIAVVHLYTQGFSDEDLVDFSLSLTPPSTIYEKEKVELWTSKVTLAGDMIEKKLFSRFWIYKNLFNMHEEDFMAEQESIRKDLKAQFRLEQIKNEGNDPAITGQSFGTKHDLATLYKGGGGEVPKKDYDDRQKPALGGWEGAGRPLEPGTYATHEHPLGWDPTGQKGTRLSERAGLIPGITEIKLALRGDKIGAMRSTLSEEQPAEDSDNLLNEQGLIDESVLS